MGPLEVALILFGVFAVLVIARVPIAFARLTATWLAATSAGSTRA